MDYEQIAKQRVGESEELSQHENTIFYDWSNWDEHMEWIATAPVKEIVSWADEIERYSRETAATALGSIRTARKARSSAANGKLGGRPRKAK